jgi:putative DNA primase/helicase
MLKAEFARADGSERRLAGRIRSLWKEARAVTDTPAGVYMATRGFNEPHPALRYHDHVPLGRGADVRFRPALLAAVEADTGVIALERLFLDPRTGLPATDLDPPKLMLGRPHGGTVRFGAATDVLGLAEGWETAWSAHLAARHPGLGRAWCPTACPWSLCLSGSNASYPPSRRRSFPGRRGADAGETGACARRVRSIETSCLHRRGFNDWNDLLSRRGERGREVVASNAA